MQPPDSKTANEAYVYLMPIHDMWSKAFWSPTISRTPPGVRRP